MTSFIAIVYGSVLQSSVVVPQVLHVDLSFDDMVNQNFTFVSSHYAFIQTGGAMAKRLLQEIRNSEKVQQIDFLNKEMRLGELIQPLDRHVSEHLLEATPFFSFSTVYRSAYFSCSFVPCVSCLSEH